MKQIGKMFSTVGLTAALILNASVFCYASESPLNNESLATGSNELLSDKTTISIPESGDQFIKVQQKGEDSILTKLPDEFSGVDGKRCSDGSVIYTCGKSLALEVRKINETERGEMFSGVQQILHIGNKNAPNTVEYKFVVTKGGKLVSADMIQGITDSYNGWYFIINKQGQLLAGIEPAEAIDSAGNPVATHYELNDGNKLVQVIEYNDQSQFPVTATATTESVKVGVKNGKPKKVKKTVVPSGQGRDGTKVSYNRQAIMIAYSGGGNSLCSVSFSASYVGIGFAVSFDVPNGRNGGSGASLNRLENGNYTKKGHTYKAYVRKTYKVTPHAEYRKLKRGTVYTRTWATHELVSNYPYLKKTA